MDGRKTRSRTRSDISPKMATSPKSPKFSKLYPDLPVDDDDDDLTASYSSNEGEYTKSSHFATSSSDHVDSSFVASPSPASRRRPLHSGSTSPRGKLPYSPTDSPRAYDLRSRNRDKYADEQNSFDDLSDDYERYHTTCEEPHRHTQIKHVSPKSPKCEHKNSAENPIIWCIVVLVIVLAGAGVYFVLVSESKEDGYSPDLFDTFKTDLGALQSKFLAQEPRSWKVLRTSIKHILTEPDPLHPAVVLMVGQRKSLPVMKCIAKKLVQILNILHNISRTDESLLEIRVEELNHRSPADEKLDLDQRLQETLTSGSKGALLVNLESLSPDAALMLHSYCDNDNAPYKNVLLVLQMVYDDLGEDMMDVTVVENHLQTLWEGELGIDRVKALFSRIANNVVFMKPEDDFLLAKECS